MDKLEKSTDGLQWGLLALGLAARIVDSIQDSALIEGGYEDFFEKYVWSSRVKKGEDALEQGSYDNPRSWLVITAIGLSLGLISQSYAEHNSDSDRRGVASWLSIIGLVVHLLVALLSLVAYQIADLPSANTINEVIALSRKRFVRLVVTTATIMALTGALSEFKWAGADHDGMSKTPSPTMVNVTMERWYTLGALISYIAADLVGHVFL